MIHCGMSVCEGEEKVFEHALSVIETDFTDIDDGKEIFSQIAGKLRVAYEDPPVVEFTRTLKDEVGVDEARMIMFEPTMPHVGVYVSLLSENLASKAASLALTLMFLLHRL